MTTDLDRLIEAVEAGTPDNFGAVKPGNPLIRWHAVSAYRGSLDAAVALLEALLPGWGWSLYNDGWAVAYPPGGKRKSFEAKIANEHSRALLLATLRAYRSTREGG